MEGNPWVAVVIICLGLIWMILEWELATGEDT